MGIYDREYYRGEDSPQGFNLGGQRMMVTNLVLVTVAIFVIDAFTATIYDSQNQVIGHWLSGKMALHADILKHPQHFWQILTYGFAHAPLGTDPGIFHVGFNMFMLWMFGRSIEQRYGRREFLAIYLSSLIVVGLVWLIVQNAVYGTPSRSMYGASGGVTAIVILFVLNFPNQTLLLMGIIPIKAWVFGLLCVGLDFFGALTSGSNVAYEAHLVGASFGLLYFYLGWNITRLMPKRMTSPTWLKPKPRLRVHNPEDAYSDLDAEADRILDKIHREGEDNISQRERRILEDYSRRMRQKHR